MARRHLAFTLAELLVVIAIMGVVAAVTFPLMRSAKESSKRASCMSQFHQAHLASQMYLMDYDDRFMPVNYVVDRTRTGANDRTWVQLLIPYLTAIDIFRCPSDTRSHLRQDAVIDVDLVPGDTSSRYYQVSLLSNIGYNYLYLSPITRNGGRWNVETRDFGSVADPSSMLMFVETIATRGENKLTTGGGSYIVAPPCRFGPDGTDTFRIAAGSIAFAPTQGWKTGTRKELDRFGRAWPWHLGRTNVAFVGGNVRPLSINQLTAGCAVRDRWRGMISDLSTYFWDFD